MSDNIKYPDVLPFESTGCQTTVNFEAKTTLNLPHGKQKAKLDVCFQPDKSTLRQDHFLTFMDAFGQHATLTPETYVSHLAAALYDALVPYKIKVTAKIKYDNLEQEVAAKKSQPGY